jgi:hypothetical protein
MGIFWIVFVILKQNKQSLRPSNCTLNYPRPPSLFRASAMLSQFFDSVFP